MSVTKRATTKAPRDEAAARRADTQGSGRDLCRNLPGVLATGFVANAEPTPHLLTAQWGEIAQYAILSDCRVVMNTASRQYFASLNQCYQSFRKLCSCAFKQFGVTNQFQKTTLEELYGKKNR